jgi:hypothetical protein
VERHLDAAAVRASPATLPPPIKGLRDPVQDRAAS